MCPKQAVLVCAANRDRFVQQILAVRSSNSDIHISFPVIGRNQGSSLAAKCQCTVKSLEEFWQQSNKHKTRPYKLESH